MIFSSGTNATNLNRRQEKLQRRWTSVLKISWVKTNHRKRQTAMSLTCLPVRESVLSTRVSSGWRSVEHGTRWQPSEAEGASRWTPPRHPSAVGFPTANTVGKQLSLAIATYGIFFMAATANGGVIPSNSRNLAALASRNCEEFQVSQCILCLSLPLQSASSNAPQEYGLNNMA